jgi:hypothetical protein
MFHRVSLWVGERQLGSSLFSLTFAAFFAETDDRVALQAQFSFTEPSAGLIFSSRPASGGTLAGVAGSGQVHPNVVRNMGLDPEKIHRFCLWEGRSLDDAALQGERFAPVFRWNLRFACPSFSDPRRDTTQTTYDAERVQAFSTASDLSVRIQSLVSQVQFPESWLREFCDASVDRTTQHAHHVAGLEVEEPMPVAPDFWHCGG